MIKIIHHCFLIIVLLFFMQNVGVENCFLYPSFVKNIQVKSQSKNLGTPFLTYLYPFLPKCADRFFFAESFISHRNMFIFKSSFYEKKSIVFKKCKSFFKNVVFFQKIPPLFFYSFFWLS